MMIVKTDIHSHLLFGIDDGSSDFNESVGMLSAAKKYGIDKIIATPHVRNACFERQRAKDIYDCLKEEAALHNIELVLGYELHCDALAEIGFDNTPDYCFGGTNNILLEFSFYSLPVKVEKIIYSLQREGLNVIIAHPERYTDIQKDISRAERWLDLGCELQVSASSLQKGILNKEKKCAELLLKRGFVQFLASDAHCAYDYDIFGRVLANIKDNDHSRFANL